ncbi:MAG: hypothetical protein CMJ90_01960 [Planctomycetes bacterium]|nr:hypothetical protein [Planctomycetota bacterium]
MKTKTRVLVATMAVAIGTSSGALAQRGKSSPQTQLTAPGQRLEASYVREMEHLRAEIIGALPKTDQRKVAAYNNDIEAEQGAKAKVEAAQKGLGEIGQARGLVGHAKGKWIGGADKGIAKAKKMLKNAKTKAERDAAREELAKWQANREDGVNALKERQARLDKALRAQPRLEAELNDANQALAEAKARTQHALAALNLESALSGNQLDARLAKYVVLKEATPTLLAAFAQQGDEQRRLIDRMLNDDGLLVQMLVADGAANADYGKAMEIYRDIQRVSDKAASDTLQRLALAIALEHARPIGQRNAKADTDAPSTVDPVKRYLHFEEAFLAGELDPAFKDLTVWDYRMAVNGEEPDEILTWGREMLRNYRPDHITTGDYRWRYVAAVRSDIRYGSQENKYDQDDLQFFQNILKNGGVCGRRAFFGRFTLRAFGIPTTARPQRGHAALTHWTPDGWVVCLGAGWGSGWTKTPYNEPRSRRNNRWQDLDFLAITQARATGAPFMQVKRAQWIGDVVGEPRSWGLLSGKPAFWNGVSLYTQRGIIEDASAEALAAVGEDIGEANETREKIDIVKVRISEKDRKIHANRNGAINIPAAATSKPTKSTGNLVFMDSALGGKQLHYSRNGGQQDFEYTFDAAAPGRYAMTMKVVTPSWKQKLKVSANGDKPIEMELPFTVGMWETTPPVAIDLVKGKNVLTFSRRGVKQEVATKGFTLKQITLTPILR